jgi:hypothetical protein
MGGEAREKQTDRTRAHRAPAAAFYRQNRLPDCASIIPDSRTGFASNFARFVGGTKAKCGDRRDAPVARLNIPSAGCAIEDGKSSGAAKKKRTAPSGNYY